MKTILLFCTLAAAAGAAIWNGTFSHDAPAGLPDCCVGEAQTATTASVAPTVPLPSRSIYQLDVSWTDDSGAQLKLASLRGRPVVVAMIFTNCQYACPMIVSDMLGIRADLPQAARNRTQFLLVSFDDIRDTPEALRAYRKKMGLDDPAWTLVRGNAGDVQELAMLLGVKYKRDGAGNFSHSNLITVLNRGGELAYQREGLKAGSADVVNAVNAALR